MLCAKVRARKELSVVFSMLHKQQQLCTQDASKVKTPVRGDDD